MGDIITVSEPKRMLPTRILTPNEYRVIRENLKVDHKTLFDAKLFTGMRETEFAIFARHPEFYQPSRSLIRLTPTAVKKVKTNYRDRSVLLSRSGVNAIERFIDYKPRVPNRASWRETLIRAAGDAQIDTTGIEPKMCRKTWECWLLSSFPGSEMSILSSQGHLMTTALKHYVGIGFNKQEVEEIKHYTDGWLR